MWLQNIRNAAIRLYNTPLYREYVFTKVVPAQDGVAFYTSHFTVVYVHNDGKIEEIEND